MQITTEFEKMKDNWWVRFQVGFYKNRWDGAITVMAPECCEGRIPWESKCVHATKEEAVNACRIELYDFLEYYRKNKPNFKIPTWVVKAAKQPLSKQLELF